MRGKLPFNEKLQLQKKFWTRGLMLTGLALAYAGMMEDDDTYKRATEAERYYYWFIHVPGLDEPVRMRVPFEAGVMFKSLPEALYQYSTGARTGREVGEGMFRTVMNSNPLAIPPAMKLFIEQAYNTQTFTGTPLETTQMQRMDPSMRYKANTTETSKAISKMLEGIPLAEKVSPVRIENAINTITTGTGMALFSMLDPLTRAMQDEVAGPVEKSASKMMLIGSAFQPNDGMGLVNDVVNMTKELERRSNTFNQLVKEGKKEEARAYAGDYAKQIALGQAGSLATKTDALLMNLHRQEQMILAAPESKIPPERKRELILKLHKQQNDVAEKVRSAYLRAGT
jgi:hypothetical protein